MHSDKYKKNDIQQIQQNLKNDKKSHDEAIKAFKLQLQINEHNVEKGIDDIIKLYQNDFFRDMFLIGKRTSLLYEQLVEIKCGYLNNYYEIINSIFFLKKRITLEESNIFSKK